MTIYQKLPLHLREIDRGKVKKVLGSSGDLVYLIATNRLLRTRELRGEATLAHQIKDTVYQTNLQQSLKSLGYQNNIATLLAQNIHLQFPTPDDFVSGLQNQDKRLQSHFFKEKIDWQHHALRHLVESALHLSVDYTLAPKLSIQGQTPIVTKRADTNLEQEIRIQKYSLPQNLSLSLQVLKGFRDLHAANYVHGDVKLENLLVYHKEGKSLVKIADWGKCKKIQPHNTKYYTGNPRFMPPERLNSQSGEVFSVGIMLVRILEEEFLDSAHKMLIEPTRSGNTILKNDTNELKMRKGIERYLILSQDCPETNTPNWPKHLYASLKEWILKKHQNIDSSIDQYLLALQGKWETKYGMKEALPKMIQLLKNMLQSDKRNRISMKEATVQFESLKRRLTL